MLSSVGKISNIQEYQPCWGSCVVVTTGIDLFTNSCLFSILSPEMLQNKIRKDKMEQAEGV